MFLKMMIKTEEIVDNLEEIRQYNNKHLSENLPIAVEIDGRMSRASPRYA